MRKSSLFQRMICLFGAIGISLAAWRHLWPTIDSDPLAALILIAAVGAFVLDLISEAFVGRRPR